MLTYAEELRQEGKIEGRKEGEIKGKIEGKIEGTVETIENLLSVGADWSLITKATGITPGEFQKLKAELERRGDAPAIADNPETSG